MNSAKCTNAGRTLVHLLLATLLLHSGAQAQVGHDELPPLVIHHSDAIHAASLLMLQPSLTATQHNTAPVLQLQPTTASSSSIPTADVIDLDLHQAITACDSGQLTLLPTNQLPDALNQTAIQQDYLPNTLQPCAIGHTIASNIMVSTKQNKYAPYAPAPMLLGDFFDVETFPGRRAIKPNPRLISEWALLDTGIRPEMLYQTLNQPQLAWPLIKDKLEAISGNILWVDNDQQSLNAIVDGQASFAAVNAASLMREAVREGSSPWHILWHQPLVQIRFWAIPVTSKQPEAAWRFIKHAAHPVRNAKYSTAWGNAPARRSATELVDVHFRHLLPSTADHMRFAVQYDAQWWQRNEHLYLEQFLHWHNRHKSNAALALLARLGHSLTGKAVALAD